MHILPNPDAVLEGAANRSAEAAKVCGARCVVNLLGMLGPFGRADRLMLSSKSNLGGYLLSWWAAANRPGHAADSLGRAVPDAFFDLDRVLRKEALPRRYFCELPWGSRRGLCASGQGACDMPQFAPRSFCRGQLPRQAGGGDGVGGTAGEGGPKERRPRAKGGGGGGGARVG